MRIRYRFREGGRTATLTSSICARLRSAGGSLPCDRTAASRRAQPSASAAASSTAAFTLSSVRRCVMNADSDASSSAVTYLPP